MISNEGKISVIVPIHNRTEYLEEAIESVAAQNVPMEVILVDDGSEAETKFRLCEFADRYSFIKLMKLDRQYGVSHARNRGIEAASGNFIHFLDDDDRLGANFFEACLDVFKQFDKTDVVIADAKVFGNEGSSVFKKQKAVFESTKKYYGYRPVEDWSYFLVYTPPIHSMLFKKEVFEKCRFAEDLRYGEDRFLWLEMKNEGISFRKVDVEGAYYRLRGNTPDRTKDQLVYFKKLLQSRLVKGGNGKDYIHTFLFLLYIREGVVFHSFRYLIKSLRSPVFLVSNIWFLLRCRV